MSKRSIYDAADLLASALARQGAKIGSTIQALGCTFLKVGEDRYVLVNAPGKPNYLRRKYYRLRFDRVTTEPYVDSHGRFHLLVTKDPVPAWIWKCLSGVS